ncbi:hypothetical protein LCGC14_3114860, partial [marine sediment metagenome]
MNVESQSPEYDPLTYVAGAEFAELLTKTISVARCLPGGESALGGWQNELPIGRFLEAAILDRICLELTVRGFVPRMDLPGSGSQRHGERQCTYQGKGVWRVHETLPDGDLTKYETGTQHLLDAVGFSDALFALRQYVGHLATTRMASMREKLVV